MRTYRLLLLAGTLGLTGVALGAFGAHALKERLAAAGTTEIWAKGVLYHLLHSAVVLSIGVSGSNSARPGERWLTRASYCWFFGVLAFSGSLYGLALGGPRWLGPVTPLGGLSLLIGWAFVLVAGIQNRNIPSS